MSKHVVQTLGTLTTDEIDEIYKVFEIYNIRYIAEPFIAKGIRMKAIVSIEWNKTQLQNIGVNLSLNCSQIMLNFQTMINELFIIGKYSKFHYLNNPNYKHNKIHKIQGIFHYE